MSSKANYLNLNLQATNLTNSLNMGPKAYGRVHAYFENYLSLNLKASNITKSLNMCSKA
jgi:hypothetical protein